jgi:hypothetical protein
MRDTAHRPTSPTARRALVTAGGSFEWRPGDVLLANSSSGGFGDVVVAALEAAATMRDSMAGGHHTSFLTALATAGAHARQQGHDVDRPHWVDADHATARRAPHADGRVGTDQTEAEEVSRDARP